MTASRAQAAGLLCGSDLGCANAVWGTPQSWGTLPPPPAIRFNNPIPIGMGARPIGMGEAFVGLADELSAIWYNPAGLTQMNKNEIQWMGGDRYTDIPYVAFLAASYMLQNRMVFALSWQRPWHPIGFYPKVNAGTYSGFTNWVGPGGNPDLIIPGTAGQPVEFTSITDRSVQEFLIKAYRAYINLPFQDNTLGLTYATPLSPDKNFSFGVNVKYLYNDSLYQFVRPDKTKETLAEVTGWAVDLGFQYRHPLRRFGKQLSFGLNLRDIVGQARFQKGAAVAAAGREVTLPPITDLGIGWKTKEFLTHADLNLSADLIYINDPALDDDANRRIYLGAEMWFLDGRIGPRAGYKMFFNRLLSGPTLGISFRYLVGMDYAYVFPAENDEATHWFTLSYRWGGIRQALPLPDVSVTVDPPIFSPKNQEYATFTLSAESKNGIERWSLSIIDRNNMVVKSYQDRGEPPAQIIWGGEDKVYRLLQDGEYTFLLTVSDHLGGQSSTPVQTLKLYTPTKPPKEEDKLDALRKLIKRQEAKEEAEDDRVQALAVGTLQGVTTTLAVNTTLPPIAQEPEWPESLTPLAEARAQAGSFGYPRLNPLPFSKSTLVTGADGRKAYRVEFTASQDNPRAILIDAADVIRVAASDAGQAVARYEASARYGKRELRVVAPAALAYSLSRGFTTREKFLEAALVTLDGEPISPSYR